MKKRIGIRKLANIRQLAIKTSPKIICAFQNKNAVTHICRLDWNESRELYLNIE